MLLHVRAAESVEAFGTLSRCRKLGPFRYNMNALGHRPAADDGPNTDGV